MALAITWTNAGISLWLCDISLESIFTENAQDSVWNNDELIWAVFFKNIVNSRNLSEGVDWCQENAVKLVFGPYSKFDFICCIFAIFSRIEYLDKWCKEIKILYLQSNLIPKIGEYSFGFGNTFFEANYSKIKL